MLLAEGHDCWTASDAGLATEGQDDNLSVYADSREAALVTFDREFSRRRLKYPIGRHIWLRCNEPRAAGVLRTYLPEVLALVLARTVLCLAPVSGAALPSGSNRTRAGRGE